MQLPFVSIVTPTYNRRANLARLLHGLREQTYPPELFELVIVDDGSDDGTVAYLRELDVPFTLRVHEQAHAGPAEARNRGVEHAVGRLIVFLDDDVLPVPEVLAEHVATHGDATDLVVIGPMSPPGDWPRPAWIRWDEDTLQAQYRAMIAGEWACSPRQFYTANASVLRERFLDAGGFDPRFKRAEDVELAFRLQDRGARFTFNPRAEIFHYASRSFAAWRRTPFQYGQYDVVMQRDKRHYLFDRACEEFHRRHPLNQLMVRATLGRPPIARTALGVLSGTVLAANRLGAARVARWGLSAIFGIQYWQGVSAELGGALPARRAIAVARRDPEWTPA
jgi:glycosyltransferase involved in cell wall biosynthesis